MSAVERERVFIISLILSLASYLHLAADDKCALTAHRTSYSAYLHRAQTSTTTYMSTSRPQERLKRAQYVRRGEVTGTSSPKLININRCMAITAGTALHPSFHWDAY